MGEPNRGVLGIESSCDESAIAVFSPEEGIKGEWISSQIDLHREYGGIVPDLASREHLKNFPVLWDYSGIGAEGDIPGKIAVTSGPGLAGCLAMGIAFARSLGMAFNIPVVGVNHLRGHAFSPFIPLHEEDPVNFAGRLDDFYPHLGLLVSGGNTLLFSLTRGNRLEIVAGTVDDASGEALDKGAKLLGLPYPGGPRIEVEAREGDAERFKFPRAFAKTGELKFSFSGLKTSLRYLLEKMPPEDVERERPHLCASYQAAVVDALVAKTRQALAQRRYVSLGLSGGVANNRRLREAFRGLADDSGLPLFIARPEHTGDNAAMIAFAAYVDPAGVRRDGGAGPLIAPAWELTCV